MIRNIWNSFKIKINAYKLEVHASPVKVEGSSGDERELSENLKKHYMRILATNFNNLK